MKDSLEKTSSIANDKNKISKLLVHRNIKYSDKKVTEKVQIIEDRNREKISKKGIMKISYMNLYILNSL